LICTSRFERSCNRICKKKTCIKPCCEQRAMKPWSQIAATLRATSGSGNHKVTTSVNGVILWDEGCDFIVWLLSTRPHHIRPSARTLERRHVIHLIRSTKAVQSRPPSFQLIFQILPEATLHQLLPESRF
jgi:hypothetical protein